MSRVRPHLLKEFKFTRQGTSFNNAETAMGDKEKI
jgi:hypothetical protein